MKAYTITPIDPLVLGDGRPFGTEPGAQAAGGLFLPPPSTLAGALRTTMGRQSGRIPAASDWEGWAKQPVHGPLLVEGGRVLLDAPSDMVLLSEQLDGDRGERLHLVRSRPGRFGEGEGCDLPLGVEPCVLPDRCRQLSPSKKPGPRQLSIDELAAWYSDGELWGCRGEDGEWVYDSTPAEWGSDRRFDIRVHVAIDPGTLANAEHQLFVTQGAVYHGATIRARSELELEPSAIHLGGERRVALLSHDEGSLWQCPPALRTALSEAKSVAMVLATPAQFDGGWLPKSLQQTLGLDVKLRSAVCRRREAVSGWDLVRRGPKPATWLAPAGSVYFLELPGGGDVLAEKWLQPVSDDPVRRADGFGLAVFFPTR